MTLTDLQTGTPYLLRAIRYHVPAASIPGVTYTVTCDAAGWRCECAGWRWRKTCRHLDECRAGQHGAPTVAIRPVRGAATAADLYA
jgi:hypothetical protein